MIKNIKPQQNKINHIIAIEGNIMATVNLNLVEYSVSQCWPFGEEVMNAANNSENNQQDKQHTFTLPAYLLAAMNYLSQSKQDEIHAMVDFFDAKQEKFLTTIFTECEAELVQLSTPVLATLLHRTVSDVFDYNHRSLLVTQAYVKANERI